FSRLLGKEAIFKIETRAILEGLCLAWKKGIHQLEVESDNVLLIETIVCFRHLPRTHNAVVDHMAKVTASRFTEIQVFEFPPHS
ncbi:hypothetical protein Gogos_021802, partial [Gossypium gossypioides]|nr:hypothetical protein [Gossypium gossypioides]